MGSVELAPPHPAAAASRRRRNAASAAAPAARRRGRLCAPRAHRGAALRGTPRPPPRASGRLLVLGVGRRGRRRALPWPPRLPRPWRAGADEAGEGGDWSWAWAPLQVGPGCQPPLPFYLLGVYLFNFG